MSIQPEDTPPPAIAAAIPMNDREQFLTDLREAMHEVVATDIHEIDADHARQAAEREAALRRMSVKLDLCVLPLAIAVFVILQFMDAIIFAEAAALLPNFGLLIVRMIRGGI